MTRAIVEPQAGAGKVRWDERKNGPVPV